MSEKILLIDGHSILNRAFYGLPDLTNSEGKHTGAVYGFLNILLRTIEEEKPQYRENQTGKPPGGASFQCGRSGEGRSDHYDGG